MRRTPRLVLIGLAAGFFSAFFGVGGGIVLVPMLVLVAGFGQRVAASTSLVAIGIAALAGVAGYALTGRVHPLDAAIVGLPAAAGALLGTRIQQRLATRALALLFAGLLVVVALVLLLS